MTAYVYLLHFSEKYPNGRQPQHYLGVTDDLKRRMAEHKNGCAKSRLMRAVKAMGLTFVVAEVWTTRTPKRAYNMERKFKRRKKGYSKICPVCRGESPAQEMFHALESFVNQQTGG